MSKLKIRDNSVNFWHESSVPEMEGLMGTFYSVANGYLGLRGTDEEMPPWASPGFYVIDSFCAAPSKLVPIHPADHILSHPEYVKEKYYESHKNVQLTTLPNLPNPIAVNLWCDDELIKMEKVSIVTNERLMLLNEARFSRRFVFRDSKWRRTIIDSERFASWDNRNIVCMRYKVTRDGHDAKVKVEPYFKTDVTNDENTRLFEITNESHLAGFNSLTVQPPECQTLYMAQAFTIVHDENSTILEVVIAVSDVSQEHSDTLAKDSIKLGFDKLLDLHKKEVAKRYKQSDFFIDTDAFTQQGFNFGLMHMEMALPIDNPKTTVLVKGITGEGYKFAILWDTEFHLFPYYLFTNPAQARNLLLYRYYTLEGARYNAQKGGYKGAKFPWEAAKTGKEECTPWLILPDNEIHISADVVYAIRLYNENSGDEQFLVDYGAEMVLEIARFFSERSTWVEGNSRYEILNIGCPDQYHTLENNNTFTNYMAKWTIDYALGLIDDQKFEATVKKLSFTKEDVQRMREVSTKMYLPQPNEKGIISEFDGYFELSEDLAGITERFCEHTQATKQPDVSLIFKQDPEAFPINIQRKNWYYYSNRCFYGSSLGMAGFALAGARIGILDESVDYFIRSSRADLDSLRADSALGVHLASYGVLWEAAVMGFGGYYPNPDAMIFKPNLPFQWRNLSFALTWKGNKVKVDITRGILKISTNADNLDSVPVIVKDHHVKACEPGREYLFSM